jgi:7-cyano-7-deazaguanine synthase
MSLVTLVSGGLDSTLVACLAREEGLTQYPLFIDYGQRARARELAACRRSMAALDLPEPRVAELAGYGGLIRSGLTDPSLRVLEDAFTPGRNLLFLLTAAAYGATVDSDSVAIGLLHEDTCLFPDQTSGFLRETEHLLSRCMGRSISVLAPLSAFHKREVVELARAKRIEGTYSCHSGDAEPCGHCIACREFMFEEG